MCNKRITEILGIQGFFVEDVEIYDARLIIDIERKKSSYCCSKCGQETFFYYDKRLQVVRDLEISGREVYLRFYRYRVLCDCQKKQQIIVEKLGFVDLYRRMTKRFEAYVYGLTLRMTVKDVSEELDIHWNSVKEIEKKYIKRLRHGIRWERIKRLAVDEVSWNGKREFITIVTDRDGQGVVWIGDGKGKETLDKFFRYVGKERYKRFKVFTVDMSKSYTASIEQHCPKADIVYDLFHLIRMLNKQLNELRASEMTKGREEGKSYHRNDKWLLVKGKEKLTEGQKIDLKELLEENKNIQKGYLLKEMLREIFKERTQTVEVLTERVKNWVDEAWNTGLKPLQSFCKTIVSHFDGIVTYFRYHITNSIAEGLNNVIKRLFRMAYGYRDKEYFKLKIIQHLSFITDSIPL